MATQFEIANGLHFLEICCVKFNVSDPYTCEVLLNVLLLQL